MPGCALERETVAECRANLIEAAKGCFEAHLSMAIDKLRARRRVRAVHGYVLHRICGSHFIRKNPAKNHAVPVPHHGNAPLKQGTLNTIFNSTGIQKPQR